jgi:Putative peptidoglycan binding domain
MQALRVGSRGLDVRRVQQALNRCMLRPNNQFTSPAMQRLVEDGIFGPKTQAMVREFQRLNQISVDGIVGPVTSYLLFPYISFTAKLAGQGRIRGISQQSRSFPNVMPGKLVPPDFGSMRSQFSRLSPGGPVGSGGAKAKEPAAGGEKDDDKEKEGFTLEASVGPGLKHEFKPWFVLKPGDDPEGAKSLATLAVEATILRKKGFEFGGELEFSRQLGARGGSSWEWEGAITGKYTNLKAESGPFSIGVSPIAELKIKQGLLFSAGAGVGGEATLELRKDLLELSVGGKIAGEWDPHEGNVQVGEEVTVGLNLKGP